MGKMELDRFAKAPEMGNLEHVPPRQRVRGHLVQWLMALLAVIVIAVVAGHFIDEKPPVKSEPSIVVKAARVTLGQMPVILNELGTVTPNATVTVLPNQAISGYLSDVPFHEGQDVKKGELLAQIDPRPYEILKQQAEAQLAKDKGALGQASSDLARYDALVKQNSIAVQIDVDQKYLVQQDEAAVQNDQANIAQYELDIAYCHITSPVTGRVGLRLVDPGNYVTGSSGSGIAVVTTMKPTTVEFPVAQNDLSKVVERFNIKGVKMPVTALTSDNSKELGTGMLYAIGNQMTMSTGTVTLRASFSNDDEILFPNEFVNVQLLVDTLTNVVLVPTPAVLSGAPGNYVYLVGDNDTVSVHKVTLGPSDGNNSVIASGLKAGDMVVIQGADQLSDGAKIEIANSSAPVRSETPGKTPEVTGATRGSRE